MPITTPVHVSGLSELQATLKALNEDMTTKIARYATKAAAKVVLEKAKALVPVDTGALKASLEVHEIRKTQLTSEYTVMVNTFTMKKYKEGSQVRRHRIEGHKTYEDWGDFYYGRFIEFGTVKMAARPFLRPAFEQSKDSALSEMVKAIREGVIESVK